MNARCRFASRVAAVAALLCIASIGWSADDGTAGERLIAQQLPDEEVERILRNGRVVSMEPIGVGISKPQRVVLELDGKTIRAAFKTIDEHKPGMTRFETGIEMNFTDNYRYERAAYLIDRSLGLHMVPVTVLRKLDGAEGALSAWVEDAINERDRSEQRVMPDDPRKLTYQRALMELFDALVRNRDRNLGNQLYTPADDRLHLIDHSRSFRTVRDLTERFTAIPASLPRSLFDALRALDTDELSKRLEGLVSRAEIKALLARRNRIVKKIDADVGKHGEAMVFQDPAVLDPPR